MGKCVYMHVLYVYVYTYVEVLVHVSIHACGLISGGILNSSSSLLL